LNKKTVKREKEEGRKRKRKEKRGFKREQGGGDVSGHEVSLVTTATDERRAHL